MNLIKMCDSNHESVSRECVTQGAAVAGGKASDVELHASVKCECGGG